MQLERPVLYAALICERIISEEDGVPTLFRVVDTVDVTLEDAFSVPVEVPCVLFTKWGGPAGQYTEKITFIEPDGQESDAGLVVTFELGEGSSSAQIRHFVMLRTPPSGTLIFRVYLNDQPYIDLPFRISVDSTSTQGD